MISVTTNLLYKCIILCRSVLRTAGQISYDEIKMCLNRIVGLCSSRACCTNIMQP